MSDENKKIEIVTGDGSDLEISPVYDHLNTGKPKTSDEKPKNIVIPQVNKEPIKNHKVEDSKNENKSEKKDDSNKKIN